MGDFENSSNSKDFGEDHGEEIETIARLVHHRNIKHAYKIDASQGRATIQAVRHTQDELKK